MMADDASHAYCKKCSTVQPVLWTPFDSVTIVVPYSRRFIGMEAVCEVCEFLIAKIGRLEPVKELQ